MAAGPWEGGEARNLTSAADVPSRREGIAANVRKGQCSERVEASKRNESLLPVIAMRRHLVVANLIDQPNPFSGDQLYTTPALIN